MRSLSSVFPGKLFKAEAILPNNADAESCSFSRSTPQGFHSQEIERTYLIDPRCLRMLKRFKIPLIATAVTFTLTVIFSVIMITAIVNSSRSDRERDLRIEKASVAAAYLFLFTTTPFWLITSYKIGAERRRKSK